MVQSFDFLRRDDAAGCYQVKNALGLDVRYFANPDVYVEKVAFEQLFEFLGRGPRARVAVPRDPVIGWAG